jgi:putative membrane protein
MAPDTAGMEPGPADAVPPSGAPEDWKTLHPASILVNLVPQAWRQVRGYWPVLVALLVGSEISLGRADAEIVLLFFLLSAVRTLIHQLTLRYRIREGRLEIRSGLFNRQTRLLGPERIQSASLVRNPFHRLAGLVEVRIEVAGDVRTEGLLSALSTDSARVLLDELEALRRSVNPSPSEVRLPEVLHRVGLAEAIGHGLSSRRGGMLAIIFVILTEMTRGSLGPEISERLRDPAFLAGLFLASIAAGWFVSVLTAILSMYRFQLGRQGDRLGTEAGLVTRRRVDLPLGRVQVLRVDEPILQRAMGYAALFVQTAGIAAGPAGERPADAGIPMVADHRKLELCRTFLPDLDLDPWQRGLPGSSGGPLRRSPLRVLLLGQLRVIAQVLGLGAIFGMAFGAWGALALLAWPLLAVGAWLDWHWQAATLTDRVVAARRGFWNRHTWLLPRDRVQHVARVQGPVARALGLGRVVVRMAGSTVVLPPMCWEDTSVFMGAALEERPIGGRIAETVSDPSQEPTQTSR